MKNLLLAAAALALTSTAFAADDKAAAAPAPAQGQMMDMSKMGPMSRAVKKEDKKGIEALYKAADDAVKKGDLNAMADLNDFPVYMATDDSQGEFHGREVGRDEWLAMMKPFIPMPKEMKQSTKTGAITFLSETVAAVVEDHSMEMGKTKGKWKSLSVVVNKGGAWKFKNTYEAGWGDAMKDMKDMKQQGAAAQPAQPAAQPMKPAPMAPAAQPMKK